MLLLKHTSSGNPTRIIARNLDIYLPTKRQFWLHAKFGAAWAAWAEGRVYSYAGLRASGPRLTKTHT